MVNVGFIIIFIGSLMQLIKTGIVTQTRMIIKVINIAYITNILDIKFCTINSNCLKQNVSCFMPIWNKFFFFQYSLSLFLHQSFLIMMTVGYKVISRSFVTALTCTFPVEKINMLYARSSQSPFT